MTKNADAGPAVPSAPKLHPLVEETRRVLEKASSDTHGMLINYSVPHLDITVSPTSLRRALSFWSSLVQLCEGEGWKVTLEKDRQNERFSRTTAQVNGERLVLRLRETYGQQRFVPNAEQLREAKKRGYSHWPSLQFTPSGVFEFAAKGDDAGWDLVRVRDGATKIDESLAWLTPAFREAADKNRTVREERVREREETRKQEERRLRAEERRAAEQLRRSELILEAEHWHKSLRLRQYLARVRRTGKPLESGNPLTEWLEWAEEVAADLDPLPRRTNPRT